MRIDFDVIRWKNFLASGNAFIEINLSSHQTTIISGKNGSGKSTFLDALSFVLFGKPFRPINKPSLCNSINQKDCVVELEFRVGGRSYKIIRGLKPNIFEIYCNGSLLNQDARIKDYQEYLEKYIIGTNHRPFTQIVALGSATFVPFMQLSAADRRSVIEDLLDIQIISTMNVILKQKILEIKETLRDSRQHHDILKVKIDSLKKLITELKSNTKSKVDKYQKEIDTSQGQVEEMIVYLELVETHIKQLQQKIGDEPKIRNKSQKYMAIENKLETSFQKNKRELNFYETNENCPTCHQDLDEDFKVMKIKEQKEKIDQLKEGLAEVENGITEANKRLEEISQISRNISNHTTEVVRTNTKITELNKYIAKLQEEIKLAETERGVTDEENSLGELYTKELELKNQQEVLITDKNYYDIATGLLKDTGIKTKIVRQYLPKINNLINKYLSQMDFFVNFTLNENFEETIKSRFRDEFSYENFSEGEKRRIDLALMFTWREVAKRKNSINTNLMIFDEILDSSLDFGGMDILLNILNAFDKKTNVFVISHRSDVFGDKFKNTIRFEKRGNFSAIIGG